MKREIVCDECAEFWRKMEGRKDYDNGSEFVRLVHGAALHRFICDDCGKELGKGTGVVCVSVYDKRTPYFKWEDDFVRRNYSDGDTRLGKLV